MVSDRNSDEDGIISTASRLWTKPSHVTLKSKLSLTKYTLSLSIIVSNVPTNVLLLCWTRIATYKAINNRWAEHTCQKLDRRWDSGRNDEFSVSRTRKQRLLQQQTREVEYWVDKYVWGGGQNLWRNDQANTVHGGPIPGQNHSWHPLQKRSGRGRKRNRPTTGRLPDHRSSKVLAQNIKY